MAIIKAVNSKVGINKVIDYVTKDEKTEKKLISGHNCSPETAKIEMQLTKNLWNKTAGRTYKHFVQSFHKDESITLDQAHQLAKEFAGECKQFKGYEVLIATHKDKDHIHSHFIVNSVNYETGYKFNMHKNELQEMKDLSDKICKRYDLSICQKGKTFEGTDREEISAYNKEIYHQLKKAETGKAESYIQEIGLVALDCKKTAVNRGDFVYQMSLKGFEVNWKDNLKYITFTDLKRQNRGDKKCKIRNNKLEKYYNIDFSKEGLENEFEKNSRRTENREYFNDQLGTVATVKSIIKNRTGEFITEGSFSRVSGCIQEIERGTEQFSSEYRENEQNSGNENKQFGELNSNGKQEYERDDEPSIKSFRHRDYGFER